MTGLLVVGLDSAPEDIPDWSAAEDNDKRVCARPLGPAPIPPACNDCRCPLAAKVSHLAALPIGSHALHLTRGPLSPVLCHALAPLCPFGELQTAMEGTRPVASVLGFCLFCTNSQGRDPSTRRGAGPTAAILT